MKLPKRIFAIVVLSLGLYAIGDAITYAPFIVYISAVAVVCGLSVFVLLAWAVNEIFLK